MQKSYWDGAVYVPQGALKQVTLASALTERWSFNVQRQQSWKIKLCTAGQDGSRARLQFVYCANNYSGGS